MKQKIKQPKALYLLFFAEMWERFSFYGMRVLLFLFMTKHFMWDTAFSGQVYGSYTGLVYLTPMLGGYLADRYLGAKKAILLGGILMMFGHFILAFETEFTFFIALALIIFGNGFFKPNISTLVGKLYEKNDSRRDSGFTIFYMGINLGAMLATLICGYLGEKVGWGYGFGVAGIGMLIGLIIFQIGQKRLLANIGNPPTKLQKIEKTKTKKTLTTTEKQHVLVIFIMAFFTIFFWGAFEQAGSSLTLFADREVDRVISFLNWEIPTTFFISLNPIFILLLAPLFSILWMKLSKIGKEPTTPIKFVIGLMLLASGFVVVAFGAKESLETGSANYMYLVVAYLLHTLGELCISPVGLSMVTKLAPIKFASLLMGVWMGAVFLANFVGGIFAGTYETMNHQDFFMLPAYLAGGAGIVLLLISNKINKMMKGNKS